MQSEMENEVDPCRLWAHSLEICRAKQRKSDVCTTHLTEEVVLE